MKCTEEITLGETKLQSLKDHNLCKSHHEEMMSGLKKSEDHTCLHDSELFSLVSNEIREKCSANFEKYFYD